VPPVTSTPALNDPQAVVLPRYEGGSLADVLPGVGAAMGVSIGDVPADGGSPLRTDPPLPQLRGWVVMLIDGLGWHLLREHADLAPHLSALLGDREPLTTSIPSTTATSLTSLGTGLTPGRHGVVGYTSRIPGTTRTLNSLSWRDGPDPAEWQPYDTALARLQDAGVDVTVVNKTAFEGSGLTIASQRGVPFLGIDDPAGRLACIGRLRSCRLATRTRSRVFGESVRTSPLPATASALGPPGPPRPLRRSSSSSFTVMLSFTP